MIATKRSRKWPLYLGVGIPTLGAICAVAVALIDLGESKAAIVTQPQLAAEIASAQKDADDTHSLMRANTARLANDTAQLRLQIAVHEAELKAMREAQLEDRKQMTRIETDVGEIRKYLLNRRP